METEGSSKTQLKSFYIKSNFKVFKFAVIVKIFVPFLGYYSKNKVI